MSGVFAGLPEKHFGCILADPPWAFRTRDGKDTTPSRTEQDPYPVMRLPDIKSLPVGDLAASDCMLMMWTVSYLQDEATEVAQAWGFQPKSLGLVWDKGRIGMGYWFRQEVEVMKIYTRGRPKRLDAGVPQVIRAPRREHSRKPDEQYGMIERLVAGPYLELFARHERPGWRSWGNEVSKFNIGGGLPREIRELLGDAEPEGSGLCLESLLD